MPRRSTTERGLGYAHQQRRKRLSPPQGDPCPFCRTPLWPGQRLDADHAVPRTLGGKDSPLRWAHASCNRRAGARLGNALRRGPRATQPAPRDTSVRW